MTQKAKVDRMIDAALADQEIKDATQPLGWFALGFSQFSGPLAWVSWTIICAQILLFVAGVYCAVQFFAATESVLAIKWGISGAVLLLMAIQLKLSLMPQLQADRVIREVKRLQLMVAKG